MASSGSFSTTAYSNRSLTFSWSRSSYSIADNTTTISWTLKGSGSASGYYKAGGFTVVIDGETVYSTSTDTRIQLYNGTVVASGTKTIKHNADGSRSFSASASGGIYSYAVNCSGSGSWTLDSIPRQATISTAPNFNDEGNPTITYSNPAGSAVTSLKACISWTGGADIAYRDISKTGTSYTFNFTDAERETLRAACNTANSMTVKFYVTTVIGGNTYYSTLDKTLSIINATPTFSCSVKDTGSTSTVFTGDNQKMIRGYNYMNVSMEATAYKGATISSYKITNGSSVINAASGDFSNSEHNSFLFEVWDSRGNTNSYTITLEMIPYVRLTANVDGEINLSTDDSTKANVTFTVAGNCYVGSFGAVDNTIMLNYTLSDIEGNEITSSSAPITTASNNTYSIEYAIDDLDYRKSYVVHVSMADNVGTAEASSKTLQATPVFDWGENDFNFNVPVTIQGGRCYSEYVLYDGQSNGAITLSDTVDNYDYIEIYFQDNNGEVGGYTKLYKPNGKTIDINIVEGAESVQTTYIRRTFYKVSDSTITPNITGAGYVLFQNSSLSHSIGTNYIYITRVVGLK